MEENQKKPELNIKDLTIKLQVLTNALVEERKKTQNYVTKIKEFEQMIAKKDNEIVNLNKQKFDLQSDLSLAKKNTKDKTDVKLNQVVNTFFNKDNINFDLFDRVKEENSALKFEYKELQKRCIEEHENCDQQKIKFDTLVALQDQQIKEAEKKVEELEREKAEQIKSNLTIQNLVSQFDKEIDLFEMKYKRLQEDIQNNEKKTEELMIQNQNLTKEIQPKKEKIKEMQNRIRDQTNTLNEMKNQITQIVLKPQDFIVTKEDGVFSKTKVKISFLLEEHEKKYIFVIDYENNKDKEQEVYDFLDVTYSGINSKNPKKFEVTVEVIFYFF